MSPLAQRIALAKLEGWTQIQKATRSKPAIYRAPSSDDGLTYCVLWRDGIMGGTQRFPDYLNDLDAVHRIETSLDPLNAASYAKALWDLTDACTFSLSTSQWTRLIRATAAQRVEALLRTFNQWDDTL